MQRAKGNMQRAKNHIVDSLPFSFGFNHIVGMILSHANGTAILIVKSYIILESFKIENSCMPSNLYHQIIDKIIYFQKI